MATACSLASISNNTILRCPIDLSFDLDEALTTTPTPPPYVQPDPGLEDSAMNCDLVLSIDLPTVATDGVCTVCMEDFQPDFPGQQVPCGHVFHATCISAWISLRNSCPLCRSSCIISGQSPAKSDQKFFNN